MKLAIVGNKNIHMDSFISVADKYLDPSFEIEFFDHSDISPIVEYRNNEYPLKKFKENILGNVEDTIFIFLEHDETTKDIILTLENKARGIFDCRGVFSNEATVRILSTEPIKLENKSTIVSLPHIVAQVVVPFISEIDKKFSIKRLILKAFDDLKEYNLEENENYNDDEIQVIDDISKVLDKPSVRISSIVNIDENSEFTEIVIDIDFSKPVNIKNLVDMVENYNYLKTVYIKRDISSDSGIHAHFRVKNILNIFYKIFIDKINEIN